jgi:multiple RNA-binding domain-containing protein 1
MIMENTRVFISGLPPTLTNDQLRKHFSSGFEVTDAHVLPNRRIGFVGFRSNAAAQEAVKHFNKTFIRMSKIAVELARPVSEQTTLFFLSFFPSMATTLTRLTARRVLAFLFDSRTDRAFKVDGDLVGAPSSKTRGEPHGKSSSEENPLKRKRDSKTGGDDPALQEYLSAMRRPTEMKTWADTVVAVVPDGPSSSTADKKPEVTSITAKPTEEGKSEIKKPKLKNLHHATPAERESTPSIDSNPPDQPEPSPEARPETEELTQNDADWLRSKTSRLLGLLDEEEEEETPSRARPAKVDNSDDEDSRTREPVRAHEDTPPADEPEVTETPDANISLIRTTGRLFLRNLPYTATESDFQPILSRFGKIGEVCFPLPSSFLFLFFLPSPLP